MASAVWADELFNQNGEGHLSFSVSLRGGSATDIPFVQQSRLAEIISLVGPYNNTAMVQVQGISEGEKHAESKSYSCRSRRASLTSLLRQA